MKEPDWFGRTPALRAMVFSVAWLRVRVWPAPRSLGITVSGSEKLPPCRSKRTSYRTMPPSAAPPPVQESSTVAEEVTSSTTVPGEDREVGILKVVFNS